MIAWFACAWLGATAVMTNARAAAAELEYFATHSGVVAAITQPKLLSGVVAACGKAKWIAVTETDNGDAAAPYDLSSLVVSFSQLLAHDQLASMRAPEPLLPLGIQYTSGTTSRPKGVVMTHANALWGGKVGAAHTGVNRNDVFLIHLPLYHVIALSYGLLTTLWAGGTVVLQPRFSASRFWQRRFRTNAHGQLWSRFACARSPSSLYPLSIATSRGVTRSGAKPWSAATGSTSLAGGHDGSDHPWHRRRSGSAGHPLAIGRPAVEYDIAIRRDDGTAVSCGETGHLFIRESGEFHFRGIPRKSHRHGG